MKNRSPLTLIALAALAVSLLCQSAQAGNGSISAPFMGRSKGSSGSAPPDKVQIVGVIADTGDGDGLKLFPHEPGEKLVTIRLYGVDAPEMDQTCRKDGRVYPCGRLAADHLARLARGKTATCDKISKSFDRTVAICRIGSLDLSAAMVEAGWAVPYVDYSNAYVDLHRRAVDRKAGAMGGEIQYPECYRREKDLARKPDKLKQLEFDRRCPNGGWMPAYKPFDDPARLSKAPRN